MRNATGSVQLQQGIFHGYDEEQALEPPETWHIEDFDDLLERHRLSQRLYPLGEGRYELLPH